MTKTVDIQKTFPLAALVICYSDIILSYYPPTSPNFIPIISAASILLIITGVYVQKSRWTILILIIHLICFCFSQYVINQVKNAKNIASQLSPPKQIVSSNSFCIGKKLNKCQLLGGIISSYLLNNQPSFILQDSYSVNIKSLMHNKYQIELGALDSKIKIKFMEPTKIATKKSFLITHKYLVLFPCKLKLNAKLFSKKKPKVCVLKNKKQIIILNQINFQLTLNDYVEIIQTKLSSLFSKYPTTQLLIHSLILGQKKFLSPSVIKTTSNLGILHLFVISGAHLVLLWSIITNLINFIAYMFFQFYPHYSTLKNFDKIKYLLPYLCCGLYVIISGSQIPAIRAFLWISTIMICYVKGTKLSVFHTFSSLIIIFHTLFPLKVFHPSWHLSMIASLFILIPSLVMKTTLIHQKHKKSWASSSIGSSLKKNMIVVLGLIPLCLYYFQQTSLWGIVYSILFGYSLAWLILPSLLIVMVLGMISNSTFEIIMPSIEKFYHLWINSIDFFPTSNTLIIRINYQHTPFYPLIFYTLVFLYFMIKPQVNSPHPKLCLG